MGSPSVAKTFETYTEPNAGPVTSAVPEPVPAQPDAAKPEPTKAPEVAIVEK